MKKFITPIYLAILLSVSLSSVRAQEQPLFGQFFPKPTGENGFEELIMAGDLVRGKESLLTGLNADATLSQKRLILSDRDCIRALALIRQGLAKKMRGLGKEVGEQTFSVYGSLRQIGRLISIEQYVLLADGRVSDAIDSLCDVLT